MIRLLLFLSFSSLVNARNFEIGIPNLLYPIKVSLPENHKPREKHHTLLYYHRNSGRPTTSLMRNHPGSKGWIVAGMTYQQQGTFTLNADTWQAERKAFHAVRKIMVDNHGTDPDDLYLAGLSKDGWYTNLMLQSESTVSGGIIMGAGHLHAAPTTFEKYTSPKPVHIEFGRSDGNDHAALNALLYHRRMGGILTLEVQPKLGHDFPDNGSPSLAQWLKRPPSSFPKTHLLRTEKLLKCFEEQDKLRPKRLKPIEPETEAPNSRWRIPGSPLIY